MPTFTSVSSTPFPTATPARRKFIVVALQKMNADKSGIAPDFHRYVVNVPSNFSHTSPQNVFTSAPRMSGTTMRPPGTFFTPARILMPSPRFPER